MFGHAYFGSRYFGNRYFGGVGATPPTATGVLQMGGQGAFALQRIGTVCLLFSLFGASYG